MKQLEKAAPELDKQCTNEVRRITRLILDGAYRNENFDAKTICSHFFEREDHSLPVFSREEKAEYESWDAALMTGQRENATSP